MLDIRRGHSVYHVRTDFDELVQDFKDDPRPYRDVLIKADSGMVDFRPDEDAVPLNYSEWEGKQCSTVLITFKDEPYEVLVLYIPPAAFNVKLEEGKCYFAVVHFSSRGHLWILRVEEVPVTQ